MDRKIAAFDFGDILYFVLIAIGGLYSLIKKRNEASKKQDQGVGETEPKSSSNGKGILEDLFKEITGAGNQPQYDTNSNTTFESDKESVIAMKPAFVSSTRLKDGEQKATHVFGSQLNKNQLVEDEPNQMSYSLRDLVVADAILNRPYE
jgi:hypothetical protein